MDDLSAKLNSLLSDPDSLSMISSLLGGNDDAPAESGGDSGGIMGADGMEIMLKLAPLLSSFKEEDDNAHLLNALRPHLAGDRQKKLDEAKKIMRIIKLLPHIKDSGLF